MSLTGLAQRRVVSITPIKGVTVIIFEVNLGKYSFDNTAKKYIINYKSKEMHALLSLSQVMYKSM